jgi:hypothetical protein
MHDHYKDSPTRWITHCLKCLCADGVNKNLVTVLFYRKISLKFCFFSKIAKGGQAYLFLVCQSQIHKFLCLFCCRSKLPRCACPQIANPQGTMINTQIANLVISWVYQFQIRTFSTIGQRGLKHLFFSALSCQNLNFHSI